jgi:hypothetical protein
MLMAVFSSKAPAALVQLFRTWSEATGLRMQDATAAALWSIMELDGAERDALMRRMRAWLAEAESTVLLPDDAMGVIETARAKAAAARRTVRSEGERKDRADKKTG